uniref:Uncharacterized protein n=2 Tax=Photinus pyralis TaxID=7054 RepID=A0A1Y1NFG0_PHOPY
MADADAGKAKYNYVVVEFPEEENEDGNVPMDIISERWLFKDKGQNMCYWPPYKSDLLKTKAVMSHQDFDKTKAGSCVVNVKYNSTEYSKAKSKMARLLQEQQDVSQTEEEVSVNVGRKKTIRTFPDFETNEMSSDDEGLVPAPPKLPQKKQVTSAVPTTPKTSVQDRDMAASTSNNACTCKCCIENKVMMRHLLQKFEKLSSDVKAVLNNPQRNYVADDTQIDQMAFTTADNEQDLQHLENVLSDNEYLLKAVCIITVLGITLIFS